MQRHFELLVLILYNHHLQLQANKGHSNVFQISLWHDIFILNKKIRNLISGSNTNQLKTNVSPPAPTTVFYHMVMIYWMS